jgi:hypothetical protein
VQVRAAVEKTINGERLASITKNCKRPLSFRVRCSSIKLTVGPDTGETHSCH